MDPRSVISSYDTLEGLYNNAVDSFDFIQLGFKLQSHAQLSMLKVDVARLKLSRWGQALSLGRNTCDNDRVAIPVEEKIEAGSSLRNLLELFNDAERASVERRIGLTSDDSSLGILDLDMEMDPIGRSLHRDLRAIAIKRLNESQLKRKVNWDLYEEKDMERFVGDVNHLLNGRAFTTAPIVQRQKELCTSEVARIGTKEALRMLQGIAAAQDRDLEEAISKFFRTEESSTNTWINYGCSFKFENNKQVIVGGNQAHGNTINTFNNTFS